MGTVMRTLDRLTGETVALKRVRVNLELQLTDSIAPQHGVNQLRTAMAKEFEILARLRHPHIISVLDYGFDAEQQPYYTMTYLPEGETILEAGALLSVTEKVELVEQLLHGLAYLHRRNILHRDIKPENVLVTNREVKLLDFGLSQRIKEEDVMGGSPFYLAPELIDGGDASRSSDLYAVGVLLYQLLVNKHPFGAFDAGFYQRLMTKEPAWEAVPAALRPILAKLLCKKSDERYQNGQPLLNDLAAALGNQESIETAAMRESYLQAAQFIGREQEIADLSKALDQLVAHSGSAWLIGGESGVGKSRLIDELRIMALVNQVSVLQGAAVEDGGLPFQIWRQPIRQLVIRQEIDDLTASVLETIVPDLSALINRPISPAPPLEGPDGQRRLFNFILQLFRKISRPTLLILDDLQWAVDGVHILKQLNRIVKESPLMIIATFRDDEMPKLPQMVPGMTRIKLNPLSSSEISRLTVSMLGTAGEQTELIEHLQKETEGNAFFLVEIVRSLAEEAGRLSAIGQKPLPETIIPQGIEMIVERRLKKLPPETHRLLFLAALAGLQLDIPLLSYLFAEIDIDSWLSTCSDAALVSIEDNQWVFAHTKLRQAIINRFDSADRIAGHAEIARAIGETTRHDPASAAATAYHWEAAGNWEKAQSENVRAGEYAASQYANEDAIRFYSRAFELLPEGEWDKQFECLLRREQLYDLKGERDLQQADLERLKKLADQLGDPQKEILVSLREAELQINLADRITASTSLPHLIKKADSLGEKVLIIDACLLLCEALIGLGNFHAARAPIEKAVAMTNRVSDPLRTCKCYEQLGILCWYMEDLDEAEKALQHALSIAEAHQLLHRQGVIFGFLGSTGLTNGYEEQSQFFKKGLEISRQTGNQFNQKRILSNLGFVLRLMGRFSEARNAMEQSLALALELEDRRGEAYVYSNLAQIAFFENNFVETEHFLDKAWTLAQVLNETRLQTFVLYWRARFFEAQQRDSESEEAYQASVAISTKMNFVSNILFAKVGLARLALRRGEAVEDQLLELLDLLNPNLTGEFGDHFMLYLTCIEGLMTYSRQKDRAKALLEETYAELMRIAEGIQDPGMRHIFLKRYPAHQKIIDLYQKGIQEKALDQLA